jgi:uncharacterized protein (DUF2141 family)
MKYLVAAPLVGLLHIASAQAASVTVVVENIESNKGIVNVALCDKGLSHEGCPVYQEGKAVAGTMTFTFDDVAPGPWAAVAYQDENSNGEFDRLLGVPREPYAISNGASENMVPTLKDAIMRVNDGPNEIHIKFTRFIKR